IIFSGHGGQGVLELASNVCYFELLKGRHVAYTPSYGPESRGGKVKCYVVISDQEIDSPIVEQPDYLVVMNAPSMDYTGLLRKGGTLFMNSSLIALAPSRDDIQTIKIPATEIAAALKDSSTPEIQDTQIAANSVMLGAYLGVTENYLDDQVLKSVFGHFLVDRKAVYIPLNMSAALKGYQFIQKIAPRLSP
ncbi:MAG TPA: 2-oxoacid:acceptor oxidoreductase family protein, partial [Nitrososphaerales archaeon]|nr:2-oxoacid:acceptor oxidoreductase family protein [Nitrososphaerales archaeon]